MTELTAQLELSPLEENTLVVRKSTMRLVLAALGALQDENDELKRTLAAYGHRH